ncbi:hypothetical protein SpiBuddy_2309 [Sphaerochaeta globosa str. Buddy]|uniref:Uncharacterized protein n=1 Tax=Sphaerochaeta globosa (strain ATCC BAA-1886 / DSM 22777 / Buddy) TaxID=158189 RepID=F0RSL5_SPHGB|nr:hypothetical protein SpiBuddy_2309 [Sphaerochaeta globosa str. Buddy]
MQVLIKLVLLSLTLVLVFINPHYILKSRDFIVMNS